MMMFPGVLNKMASSLLALGGRNELSCSLLANFNAWFVRQLFQPRIQRSADDVLKRQFNDSQRRLARLFRRQGSVQVGYVNRIHI